MLWKKCLKDKVGAFEGNTVIGKTMILRALLFFSLLVSGVAQAYDFADGSINVPDGFEGPFTQAMGQGASSTAFKFPHGKAGASTLLQITTWDSGQIFPEMSIDELKKGSKNYLLQFLSGIEKRRENFKHGQIEFIEISAQPTAKISWSGDAQGENLHGIMYCLIFNSKVYSFHTQDFVSFNEKYTRMAVNAFESIKLNK